MDDSPNAPQLSGGALACGVTHPTKLLAMTIVLTDMILISLLQQSHGVKTVSVK